MATPYQLKNLPAYGGMAISPDDNNDLSQLVRGVMVGTSGTLKVTFKDGSVATLPAIAAGVIHPIVVRRVWQTGTTATTIVGLI